MRSQVEDDKESQQNTYPKSTSPANDHAAHAGSLLFPFSCGHANPGCSETVVGTMAQGERAVGGEQSKRPCGLLSGLVSVRPELEGGEPQCSIQICLLSHGNGHLNHSSHLNIPMPYRGPDKYKARCLLLASLGYRA